jgi:CBS domain-containing protein
MTPVSDLKTVAPADDLAAVLGLMASGGLNQIPVVEGKLLRGMIERSGIIEFIQARQLLGVERRPDEADPEPARLGR